MLEMLTTKRLKQFGSSIAPGVFLIGYVIGTGSVTTMAAAGAKYGLSLIWTGVVASLFTYIMFVAISKATIVTGKTLLHNFREHFGSAWAIFVMAGLMTTQIASIIGVMGIVSDVVREATIPLTADGAGVPTLYSALFFSLLLYGLFWIGRHQAFLKVLAILVAFMGFSFIATMLMVLPEPTAFLRGLIPAVPDEGNAQLLIAGMVGTTMASVCLITRSTLVIEKGWTPKDFKTEHRDALISVTMMLVINVAIMAAAAGTLFVRGMEVRHAVDMIQALEPLAGSLAAMLFVVGIVSAGLSSLFPNYLLGVWLLSDYLGLPRDTRRPAYRILVAVCASVGLVIPIFGGSPVAIMIASQAISPVIMPVMAVLTALLLLKKDVVGPHENSRLMNAGLAVTVLFTFYMLYTAVLGFAALMG